MKNKILFYFTHVDKLVRIYKQSVPTAQFTVQSRENIDARVYKRQKSISHFFPFTKSTEGSITLRLNNKGLKSIIFFHFYYYYLEQHFRFLTKRTFAFVNRLQNYFHKNRILYLLQYLVKITGVCFCDNEPHFFSLLGK